MIELHQSESRRDYYLLIRSLMEEIETSLLSMEYEDKLLLSLDVESVDFIFFKAVYFLNYLGQPSSYLQPCS